MRDLVLCQCVLRVSFVLFLLSFFSFRLLAFLLRLPSSSSPSQCPALSPLSVLSLSVSLSLSLSLSLCSKSCWCWLFSHNEQDTSRQRSYLLLLDDSTDMHSDSGILVLTETEKQNYWHRKAKQCKREKLTIHTRTQSSQQMRTSTAVVVDSETLHWPALCSVLRHMLVHLSHACVSKACGRLEDEGLGPQTLLFCSKSTHTPKSNFNIASLNLLPSTLFELPSH